MKPLQKPKAYAIHPILINGREVGCIQLVRYGQDDEKPHIEFALQQEYRNQGIMGRELPVYLKRIAKKYPRLIALVKEDNAASIKLLQNNGFCPLTFVDDTICYVIDLNCDKALLHELMRQFRLNISK